ncbi:sugar phosphate isomerase/epimerase [Reichenbachiella agarivorans]|uniref:Sugar phosphate isomerase/epimerase n=1 Tax=Reichenbachiella agarivorans TaxID=2979464 RepID=A0ABY6CN74_9BACT|nr:sugar phosphate isomerase/epimerase [Reichenbachiella agarivorans]UXP31967.1 sugar phosphate isomerase/epimerase [Reichenbachiella agarivorans]
MINRNSILLSLFAVCAVTFSSCSSKTETNSETVKVANTSGIGLQLYTVRDAMAADPVQALTKISQLGYQYLELAGYDNGKFYGYEPAEFKAIIDSLGMTAISSHTSINFLEENPELAIESSKALGLSYIVLPWLSPDLRDSIGDYQNHIALMNKVGPMISAAGMTFAYHNHDFEFDTLQGQVPMELILAQTDPAHVKLELDLYWVSKAGLDPIAFMSKIPRRVVLWHVKDMDDSPEQKFTEVGNGTINYAEIFKQKESTGMEYFFIEQDQSDAPMTSIETSINYVKQLLK